MTKTDTNESKRGSIFENIDKLKKSIANLIIENEDLMAELEKVKTQERNKEKWIRQRVLYSNKTVDLVICPNCREEYSYDAETGISMDDYKFCPNCGVKMKGADDEKL